MNKPERGSRSISVALVGSGGAGVMTAGAMLLDVAATAGFYGLMTRSAGPQIRGGEAAALLRLSATPIESHDDCFDLLLAIDWQNFDRFASEVPLGPESVVITSPGTEPLPTAVIDSGARIVELPLQDLLKDVAGGRINMLALGIIAGLVGLPAPAIIETITQRLAGKGLKAIDASSAAILAGYKASETLSIDCTLSPAAPITDKRWLISGNEAIALGALRGGVRFVAGYPITPATDILEWLASRLPKVGGALVQAEDELASLNMIIGASFGGVPSLTATSGPGLALMTEAIGLAVTAEVPIVVIDVMRCGPSTGIATKSEQSDLNIATYGLHGDAPHIVLAPNSVADCALTGQWAVHLAERLQTAAIVLSDQFLGQARAVIARPDDLGLGPDRQIDHTADARLPGHRAERYALTQSGVSPMTLPGMPGGQYIGEGLTHNKYGSPTSEAGQHLGQIDKRQAKFDNFDFGERWADIEGDGELAIISWGSVSGPLHEAVRRLNGRETGLRLITLRLIAPVQPAQMTEALAGVRRVIVIEQSHSGQLYHYLRAHYDLPRDVTSFRRPGPLTFSPGEILAEIERQL